MFQFIFGILYTCGLIFAIYWSYRFLLSTGNKLANYLKINLSGHLLPLSILVLIALWVYASYSTFKAGCKNSNQPVFYSHPASAQKGFAVERSSVPFFVISSFDPYIALATYNFKFVEENGRRSCKAEVQGKISNSCVGLENERVKYVVKILPWKRADNWWHPPIYTAEYQVQDIETKKLLASAKELIFGGGIVSVGMRMFGGDQDYALLGCGYVSNEIGPVRPTLMNKREMRHHAYGRADLEFVTRALFPFESN